MKALVSFITRRKSGSIASRDVEVECEVLRFGRGADNEVQFADPRAHFYEAELHDRGGTLYFESSGKSVVLIDGAPAPASQVRVGTKIEIGPYEIVFVEAADGYDTAITVELLRPLGDSLELLKQRSQRNISESIVSKRKLSWVLALSVLFLFFAVPLASFFAQPIAILPLAKIGILDTKMKDEKRKPMWEWAADRSWDTGDISGPHKFLADNCKSCHTKPFVQVTDEACTTCHSTIEHHVDPSRKIETEISSTQCQDCHKEHAGSKIVIRSQEQFCLDCHEDLKKIAPDTKLLDSASFDGGHPEFRPTIVVDANTNTRKRLALNEASWTAERSNMKFTHKKHLAAKGLRSPVTGEIKVLGCGDCHRTEPGGVGLRPIEMERDCIECHQMKFAPKDPTRLLHHGDVDSVLRTISEFYSEVALNGGSLEGGESAPVRRRPGQSFTEQERLEALAWAKEQAKRSEQYVFGKSICGQCHTVSQEGSGDAAKWKIAPVELADRWMPKGKFHHARHEMVECKSCHDAYNSDKAEDVILPTATLCEQCHSDERAADKVPSGCIMCHDFHIEGLPSMHHRGDKAILSKGTSF